MANIILDYDGTIHDCAKYMFRLFTPDINISPTEVWLPFMNTATMK